MTIVCSNTLAIVRVPQSRLLILAAGNDQVTITIVLHHRKRAFMTLEQDRALSEKGS